MFEKEAEEYRKDLKSKFFLSEPQLDLACQGFKDGYNKANEWHYVKDGDFPEDNNKIVLCICGNGFINGEINYVYRLLTRREFSLFAPVYRWKEIIPSEEMK